MYIIEKKRRKTAFAGIVLSLAVLLCSALYLKDIKDREVPELVFSENSVLMLPEIIHEDELIDLPMRINAQRVVSYFDVSKSDEELVSAVTEYQSVYRPSQSVCYSFEGKVFEVTAMASGTVSEIYTDELMGKCVEVDCGNGLLITYQSLSSVSVSLNQNVAQYDMIGLAGENSYHADLGIHAQITAHKDGKLIDPESLLHLKVEEIN